MCHRLPKSRHFLLPRIAAIATAIVMVGTSSTAATARVAAVGTLFVTANSCIATENSTRTMIETASTEVDQRNIRRHYTAKCLARDENGSRSSRSWRDDWTSLLLLCVFGLWGGGGLTRDPFLSLVLNTLWCQLLQSLFDKPDPRVWRCPR